MTCPVKFRPDEDEQLIELVHATPCLWNVRDPDFKREKRFIWADIGKKLTRRPRTGLECKSRWRSIRDYYKKQRKDEKCGGNQPAVKRRQVYWDSLRFLDDVEDELNALSVVHVELSEDADMEPADYLDSEGDDAPTKKRKLKEEVCENLQLELRNKNELENDFDQLEESKDSNSDRLDNQTNDKFKQFSGRAQNDEGDEIDLFFRAMAATVKKFSPRLKVLSKSRVFSVVNELELRHLESLDQSSSFTEVISE